MLLQFKSDIVSTASISKTVSSSMDSLSSRSKAQWDPPSLVYLNLLITLLYTIGYYIND